MPYECKFCLKEFKRESSYMKHECREMIRNEELKSIKGQAAYSHYSKWMKLNKRSAPEINIFANSRYYNSFIKFGKFVKKIKIPKVDKFIQLMIARDISPILWTRDECYAIYLEWNDKLSDPFEQAEITIDTLNKISDMCEVNQNDVFDVVDPREIVQLIRLRKLSPWLLLCSNKFKKMFSAMDDDDKHELEAVVSYGYWAEKFEKNPDVVKQMKEFAKELGI